MPELWLMRHAKAEAGAAGMADIDRPLAPAGVAAAAAMGRAMGAAGMVPDAVVISPARRVRETWAAVAATNPHWPAANEIEALYGADGTRIQAIFREWAGGGRLLVIGHNPTMYLIANQLAGAEDSAGRDALAAKFPTGALAVLAVSAAGDEGRLLRFLRPRDL